MMLRTIFSHLVPAAHAVTVDPCISGANIRCESDIAAYLNNTLLGGGSGALFIAFAGIFFASMVYYGFRLALESRSDTGITNLTSAITQALFGAALVSGAFIITNSFITNDIVDSATLQNSFLAEGLAFIVQSIGFVLLANIVIQGFRLIMAINEGNVDTARNNLIQSFVGAALVMLARPVLELVIPGSFNGAINAQFVGIANFLVTIFGVLVVLTIIVAGIMLVISVNDSLKDRARNLIIASLVALIVIIVSIALITILLPT